MSKFTVQEVIDMGAQLVDEYFWSRGTVRDWLTILVDNNKIEGTFDFERVFDLIVG